MLIVFVLHLQTFFHTKNGGIQCMAAQTGKDGSQMPILSPDHFEPGLYTELAAEANVMECHL